MKKYEVLIFTTGAVTLALEVLASRIMTPYFGVSLYIWSGILSITLTFLAIGYWWGGRLSSRLSHKTLEFIVIALPPVTATALGLSAILYPLLFPLLAQVNLVFGSFTGAAILLAIPLIVLSALNPLLIGLQREDTPKGDSGAGRIFFISTIGSVAGVVLTAFVFIPNMTNFRAVLLLCVILCAASMILVLLASGYDAKRKRNLLLASLVIAIACSALATAKDTYFKLIGGLTLTHKTFTVIAEYTSLYGNIKIAEVKKIDGSGVVEKYFIQDGVLQNRTDPDNRSLSSYTYVLEALSHSFEPEARNALVLGLGAGVVPGSFRNAGLKVSVVEINPMALQAATGQFGFDSTGIEIQLEDARTFVRQCRSQYDVVVVDLFLGDSIPDYLMTREFFSDLGRCIRDGGSVVMNAAFDFNNHENNKRLLATVGATFPRLFLAGMDGGNIYIVATTGAIPEKLLPPTSIPPDNVAERVWSSLANLRPVPPQDYADSEPITDEHNIYSVLFAEANMIERQDMVRSFPLHILVN